MSERLRHLQRQRALLGEHLAWIDSEIARETPAATAPVITVDSTGAAPSMSPPPAPEPASDAEALIEKYAADERQNPTDIRRGCLYIFAAAVLLLASGVTAVWLLFYR